MRPLIRRCLFAGACLMFVAASAFAGRQGQSAAIRIDYPADGAIFPPDITAPTFLWRDPSMNADAWRIEIAFGDGAAAVRIDSKGEPLKVGEVDEECVKAGAVPPTLTPEEAEAHAWKPDETVWAAIKTHSVRRPAALTIVRFRGGKPQPESRGRIAFRTSADPVGAPIFFRDVPLVPPPIGERGIIMPLPAGAVPLIAWRLRSVSETRSRLMMRGLPTCANCHSFSHDGKTMGLDVDGPQNDKGLYAIVPVKSETSIRNDYVIRWSSFAEERASKRFGFMSQVSPNGQYVVTSIENPGSHMTNFDQRLFNGFYKDYGFGQVFYPTRGVLAWYSKATGKLQTLPGADDPAYVQTSAFWSPDGKYLVYSRAKAKDPYTPDQKEATYANDPNETQIQYDLYRIPFNGGKGGKAEPVEGASQNGMSNNFPKVSPDGRWIVFVENKNGLLMRPDSRLFIVPFQGGRARPLRSNTPRMNSWHSFSPNGRWLVFASKGRSLYTQMYLTHIDENGNDSAAILIENATAANRGVNIPEFVNVAPDFIRKMDAPATEFYRVCDVASDLVHKGDYTAAVAEWTKALELEPEDPKAHHNLAVSLQNLGRLREAATEYRKSLELNPENSTGYTNLGVSLAGMGEFADAIEAFNKALGLNPQDAQAENNLAAALIETGRTREAIGHCRKAVELDPEYADAHNALGIALAMTGQLDEAIPHIEKAVSLNPESIEYEYNAGRVLAAKRSFERAIPYLEKAVQLSGASQAMPLEMLAAMYSEVGRFADAAQVARRGADAALNEKNYGLAQTLRGRAAQYEAQAARKQP